MKSSTSFSACHRLPPEQRAVFDAELARIEEAEWVASVAEARDTAKQRGIDDGVIARAVESLRYGDARHPPSPATDPR